MSSNFRWTPNYPYIITSVLHIVPEHLQGSEELPLKWPLIWLELIVISDTYPFYRRP
ncbi:hypothetical protein ACU8KH_06564 [Lachancea thermotolerans]